MSHKLYHDRKKVGLCTGCGTSSVRINTQQCTECANKANNRTINWRKNVLPITKSLGMCTRCTKKAVIGKMMCSYHGQDASQRSLERRRSRINNGICARCGKVPPKLGILHCNGCSKRDNFAHILSKYGLTENEFSNKFEEQNGCCGICGTLFDNNKKKDRKS